MTSNAVCAEPECTASYKDHNWGTTKAGKDGWFMQKDGTSWCPDHIPEWVEAWRNRNSEEHASTPPEEQPPVAAQSDLTIYTCDRCGEHKVGNSPFEADKPVGFWIDLLKVTGEKYPHHAKTPAPVFFCTKECMLDGLKFGISGLVKDTVPIGLQPHQRPRWARS